MVSVNASFEFQGISIGPGESRAVRLPVARLPTGTLIDVPIYIFRGASPGPTLLLQAGLHGDEVGGVEIVRRMLSRKTFDQLASGTVVVIPILNVFGFIHFSRDVPDGKDINRSFPGTRRGSLASRVAYHHVHEVLSRVDAAIDYHTGGGRRHNHPQIRFTPDDDASHKLATAFAAPFVLPSKLIPRSFRHAAFKRSVPVIIYEAGESLRLDDDAIEEGIRGAQRVMAHLGLTAEPPLPAEPVHLGTTRWLRAARAGLFRTRLKTGVAVTKGQELGRLSDAYGQRDDVLSSPTTGHVITLNHMPVVNQGDALIRVGVEVSPRRRG